MKKWALAFLASAALLGPQAQLLANQHPHTPIAGTEPEAFSLQVVSGQSLRLNQPNRITLRLRRAKTGTPVTLDMLKSVHTQQLHLLAIDPMMKDYHHIHPKPGSRPGEYTFTFVPSSALGYRLWADITPHAENQQYYVVANLALKKPTSPLDQRTFLKSTVPNLDFVLKFDQKPKVNQPVIGEVQVFKDGKLLDTLQPVMGAYAHIVAFHEDFQTLMHIHPMGETPATESQTGTGRLRFHIQPQKAGFVKLFVQIKVNHQDVYAPLAFRVQA